MKITVPATSANLGPGFDSIGLAVSKYLTIEILEESENWFIEHSLGDIPTDESNLLVTTALEVSSDLKPHRIKMTSDIPLARGLGSSSSVIVAGIELANQLNGLSLSNDKKLEIANKIEGHPDNVAPAIFGNLVISSQLNDTVDYVISDFPSCALTAFIPSYELKTSESRGVLPKQLSYKESVSASAVANLAVASLLSGDLEKAGKAIEADLFHEKYRQSLIKEFDQVKHVAHQFSAYATYLSGAGPTIMILSTLESAPKIIDGLNALSLDGEVVSLSVDKEGVRVE